MMHIAPKYGIAEIPTHFRDLAVAYLDCSERLCDEMTDGVWEPNYHRGQAVMWLAFHATELLLKGCIWRVAPQALKNIRPPHSLQKLLAVFSTHFPDLPFQPPFEAITGGPDENEWVLEVDHTLHEQLRYPTNRVGSAWPGERAFDPLLFSAEIERLRSDVEHISSAVFSKKD